MGGSRGFCPQQIGGWNCQQLRAGKVADEAGFGDRAGVLAMLGLKCPLDPQAKMCGRHWTYKAGVRRTQIGEQQTVSTV